ncbi:MAG: hypothetical protein A4S09_10540 [Proteobacteria bacterium SG_bin7]|nr:MAG: hypothetical protein A4S09_10540 [Proteobacteria bacterium SG_bin7]
MNFIAKHFFKKGFSQKGQGAVEYILLMFVVVMVICGFLWQFNDAFAKWGQNYFGNYIACLLEYGELPTLGGGTQVEGCDSAFTPFSITDGRNPMGPQIGQTKPDESKNNGGNGENGGQGRTTSDSFGGGRNIFGNRNSNISRGSNSGSLRGGRFEAAGSDDSEEGEDLFGSRRNTRMTTEGPRETVIRPRQIYYSLAGVAEEKKKKEEKKPKTVQEAENKNTRPPRLTVRERTIRQTAAVEDTGFNVGFGGFIRFIFIFGIIIAIIILLGSQALQISKGWD